MITSVILASATATAPIAKLSIQMILSGMVRAVVLLMPAALFQVNAIIAHHGLSRTCPLPPLTR